MLTFIGRRLLSAIPTLFVIITISFFLIRLAPGGPFDLERPLEAKVMENLNRIYQILFGLPLAWLPLSGWNGGSPRNLVLPVIVLALPQIAVIARMTRAAMIENLRSNHIRTLRSLGLPLRVIVIHALRGAALPVVSYLGPAAAALLTG